MEVDETAIRGRHELYRLVLENVSDLIALANADGRILYASPSHERTLGWTPDELVGFDAMARLHPDDAARVAARLAEATQKGSAAVEPARFQRRDGAWITLEATLVAVGDSATGEALVLSTARDVTAERAAAAAVRESRDLFESVLAAVPDAITIVSDDGRIVFANPPALDILGYDSADELFARSSAEVLAGFELLTPEGEPLPLEQLATRRAFAGEDLVEQEVRYRVRRTGEDRASIVRAVPVRDAAGRPRFVISVFHDVTARRRADADRRRIDRLTEPALSFLSLDELLDELLTRLIEVLGADTAAIFLGDATGTTLDVRATKGLEAAHVGGRRIPIGSGFVGRVVAERRPMAAQASDVELADPLLHDLGVNSLVAVPLLVEGEPIGALRAGAVAAGRFDEGDTRMLAIAGDRIALAVKHASLYAEAQQARTRLEFLAEASDVLASSLDVDATLAHVADLVVPRLADLCAVHVLAEDGLIRPVAIAHVDPAKTQELWELQRRHPYHPDDSMAVPTAVRTGEPQTFGEVTRERIDRLTAERPELEPLLRELVGLSSMTIPLVARGRTLGSLSLASSAAERRYGDADLAFAEELARRAAVAVDNALLYREAEERGRVARILESVGDGVFLVAADGVIRYWNDAAAAITGLPARAVVDRPAVDAIPGWAAVEPLVPLGSAPQSMPLQLGAREAWVSISGVSVDEGTVYAFRDLSEERALEELRADFVATVSHELRTPLAAIYGAAVTLRRDDVRLAAAQRDDLLGVIGSEADRLARTVNDILWASRVDSDTLRIAIESCDARELVDVVVSAQRTHLPTGVELDVDVDDGVGAVAADEDKVKQVLVNLVDNAVKYSPDGGRVSVRAGRHGAHVRFTVADEGLGIPHAEQRRIFDKFYRLDPQLTRGVGGTGLGLYISRELVRRMNGRIWVDSAPGRGSTFFVELPVAGGAHDVRTPQNESGRPDGRPEA